jgi:hypothetical protein
VRVRIPIAYKSDVSVARMGIHDIFSYSGSTPASRMMSVGSGFKGKNVVCVARVRFMSRNMYGCGFGSPS